jgi:hypothetical protein
MKDGKPIKEEPVKEHDHGMDALRYLVASIARPPAQARIGGERI